MLNRFNDTPAFYRNQASGARLSLSLMGRGAQYRGRGGEDVAGWEGLPFMQRTVIAGGRYLSHGESKQVFAMPSAQAIASLRIRWPDGSQSVHDSLMAQQHHFIQQPAIPELPADGCLNHVRPRPTTVVCGCLALAESRFKALPGQ